MKAAGDARPIGIFDSGIGGLSVWQAIVDQLPNESTVYVADQAHVPYGPRLPNEILTLALRVTAFLTEAHDCKLIVVACNSASAAALQHLRRAYPDVPFVGMEPAIKPAAALSLRRVAGVLATPATLSGELYRSTVARHAQDMRIIAEGCPGLVDAIEGCADASTLNAMLEAFVAPSRAAGADVMVMACTHYPLIKTLIAPLCGAHMRLIDPSPAVARQTARLLTQHALAAGDSAQPQPQFFTTAASVAHFEAPASHWLGQKIPAQRLTEEMESAITR
ncbi:glutamate racemase [Algiphilus sp. NNCM1]|uniref:glutamate racemase n=1 Tax=Algiphilus sp. TaxID=1872431 RepID=UPI001CA7002F|nr:glutamate racemase [Algiphilus sp.]MBY8966331.1 glutamate racemase [Algiphilus acroporae]MCI5102208.1 glutamate racemase [Algiphilus sp.]